MDYIVFILNIQEMLLLHIQKLWKNLVNTNIIKFK